MDISTGTGTNGKDEHSLLVMQILKEYLDINFYIIVMFVANKCSCLSFFTIVYKFCVNTDHVPPLNLSSM